MKTLYIIRGVSGSGKTTYAKKLAEASHCNYWEADQFFETNGVYKFDPTQLQQAHAACLENVATDIRDGKNVIVSNTFTRQWEMVGTSDKMRYIDFALHHGYRVVIIECIGQYQNTHGVSERTIAKQKARYESFNKITSHYPDMVASGRIVFLQASENI